MSKVVERLVLNMRSAEGTAKLVLLIDLLLVQAWLKLH